MGENIPFLSPGMEFFVESFQSILVNMGINLSGGNVRMSEHHLYGPQIGAMAEKMGGKGVSNHMGGDFFVDTGSQGGFSNNLPES